jgi:hypothetical protein
VSRTSLLALAGLLAAVLLACLSPASAEEGKSIDLFNGKDFTGWKFFLDPRDKGKTKPEDVWSVQDGTIVCKGKPYGYIITAKEYGNYVLELEWKWPDKPGNSGVLMHISGENKIWPRSFEAQLYAGHAGDIWLVDGYEMEVDKSRQDPKTARHYYRMKKDEMIEKKPGEWNKYKITCKGNRVKLEVNGTLVNEGKNAESTKGKILLQSEGAPICFRNIKLTPLPSKD